MRKTKIICTLGPASSTQKQIEELMRCGMNIARFNFSHGTHESHKKLMDNVKAMREKHGLPVAIMLDTRGPEIRIREVEGGSVMLREGDLFTLTTREVMGTACEVTVSYKELPQQLKAGSILLIDDGKIKLVVREVRETDIVCVVTDGGEVRSKKSVNVPNARLEMPYLSERDEQDLLFGIEQDVDFVAASFVRRKDDVIRLRKFLDYHGGHSIKIISKIENIEGVENFDEILLHSDGIMVARGDMGVEVPFEQLPGIQKKFIRKCYQSGKMVITATQMLESMTHSLMPTRAEITDVANAVFDGTSAVMLSGETTVGDHPAEVVRVMDRIVRRAESDAFEIGSFDRIRYDRSDSIVNAVCDAACTTARDMGAKAIVAVTMSGDTARGLSKFRPVEAIVAATPNKKSFYQLSLSWGVEPVLALTQETTENLFRHAVDCAKQLDMVSAGDKVVIVAGLPLQTRTPVNTIKVETV